MRKTLLRTDKTHDIYQQEKTHDDNFMLEKMTGKIGKNWGICPNGYPYDAIAEEHNLLFSLKGYTNLLDLSAKETDELFYILQNLRKEKYDAVIWNLPHAQSIPQRLHFHLMKWRIV